MTDAMTDAATSDLPLDHQIGANNPPTAQEMLRDEVLGRHKHLKLRTDELLTEAAALPEKLTEALSKKTADFIKSLLAHLKSLEGARVTEKEEYLAGGRVIDGIFRTQTDPLVEWKAKIAARLKVVQDAKDERLRKEAAAVAEAARVAAEARRFAAEEQARIEREEAARVKKLADEAEAALEKQRREAREATEKAERVAREAAEAAEAAQREAERRKKVAEEAEEESKRKRDKAKREADAAEKEANDRAAEAIAAEQRSRDLAKTTKTEVRAAEKTVATLGVESRQTERVAVRAERVVVKAEGQVATADAKVKRVDEAKPGVFGSIRSEYGAHATLAEFWTSDNVDRATLDLEKLRPHIPIAALEQAVRSFVAAGGRDLAGADIFIDTKNPVR